MPLTDMLGLFPALQQLSIYQMDGILTDTPVNVAPPQGLRSLWLCEKSVRGILEWLHAFRHLPGVESLTLPALEPYLVLTVCEPLQQLNGVRFLDIDVTFSLQQLTGE